MKDKHVLLRADLEPAFDEVAVLAEIEAMDEEWAGDWREHIPYTADGRAQSGHPQGRNIVEDPATPGCGGEHACQAGTVPSAGGRTAKAVPAFNGKRPGVEGFVELEIDPDKTERCRAPERRTACPTGIRALVDRRRFWWSGKPTAPFVVNQLARNTPPSPHRNALLRNGNHQRSADRVVRSIRC